MIFKDAKNLRTELTAIKQAAPAIAGMGILCTAMETYRELHDFMVKRYLIRLRANGVDESQIKIAFLSDLHGKEYGKDNEQLLRIIRKENPDYILVGGDMMTREDASSDPAAVHLLKEIADIAPIYMANGNHEQKMKLNPGKYGNRYSEYKKVAEEVGAVILENESVDLKMRGLPVRITGLEIPVECYGFVRHKKLTIDDMEELIGVPDSEKYNILLAHSPTFVDTYRSWGADLVLCGHLHGGIIGIPGYGGLISPQEKWLFPKYSGGLYQKKDKVCIISRGLGTHSVNLRVFNPAELVMITLQMR